MIKSAPKLLGEKKWILNFAEKKYGIFSKKYAVTKKSINKGDSIKSEDITFKRTNVLGLSPKKAHLIFGRKAKKNLKLDQIIKISDTTK